MATYNGMNVLARRLRMFRRDPHCYWCGIETRLHAQGFPFHATVDHLYSKLHPLRPTYHKAGSDRTAVLHVLACAECNQLRGKADETGIVFVPKLTFRREIALLASAAHVDIPARKRKPKAICTIGELVEYKRPKRALMLDDVRGFGWTDSNGDLRPRSWEEYCNHRPAFIGAAFRD